MKECGELLDRKIWETCGVKLTELGEKGLSEIWVAKEMIDIYKGSVV